MAYSTISKPSDYFNTKLYSGTGSSQNITGCRFSTRLGLGLKAEQMLKLMF